ncbi:MAG: hypothetical protein RR853_08755, partial [Aurantimicrobium sp.]|uniref:hypothetical protein n=1 Tax=Aurantimicrobium sp. TaxID=1930784 RepID=UPI002FCAF6A2
MVNPYRTRGKHFGRGEAPPQFKPAGKKPVKGGRWSVRKQLDGRWRAWSNGAAKRYNHTFYTHMVAVRWAQTVAQVYNKPGVDVFHYRVTEYLKNHYDRYRRADLVIFIRDQGGIVDPTIIARIMGISHSSWGRDLAILSARNASSRDRY